MRNVHDARAALETMTRWVGSGERAHAWIEPLMASSETCELGAAITLTPFEPVRAQVYFNPRARSASFRAGLAALLEGSAIDAAWLRELDRIVPAERTSTIVGFDLEGDVPDRGTIYFEEVDRFFGTRAQDTLATLAATFGLPVGEERGRVGAPYIWAFDFGRAGPDALKVYRFAPPGDRAAVEAELRRTLGASTPHEAALDLLFGGEGASGYIVQRVHADDGSVRRHKVYRCHDYEHAPSAPVIRHALDMIAALPGCASGVAAFPDALLDPAFGTTSVALAFAPAHAAVEYATVYQCLLRR